MDNIDSIMLQQIKEIDARDESQIMAELAGETLSEYFYEVVRYDRRQKKNIRKVKLSWVGTREVARNRGNIMLDEPQITETDTHWRIVVKATDLVRNFTVFGGCHQPKMMKMTDVDKDSGEVIGDKIVRDDYAFEKGLSKAQRNALDKCIPGDYAAKALDRMLRSAGRAPLMQLTEPKRKPQAAKASPKTSPQETPPTEPMKSKASDKKPVAEWEKISKEMVPDYPHLEPLMWNLCKLQPKEMYTQLGVSGRNDMTIPAWEAFLTLKSLYCQEPLEDKQEED